ncbi:MAG: hypothetical protein OXR73_38555 [Myxococcales bacterium]|nr:hypothetical protein [Myxococcales bacterium]
MFYLAYYLHWPPSEILRLSIYERKDFVRMLSERIEQENSERQRGEVAP